MWLGFRFWLIKAVVGRIPVMVNMKVTVPKGYAGNMVYNKPADKIGYVDKCLFGYNQDGTESLGLITGM